VLTAAQMTSLQQTAMLGGNATAKTISYTLVAADAGTTVAMSNAGATTITVNTSLFAAGDIVTIYNQGAGVCTITAGTATVNTSGSLVLAQYQGGVLYFISASAAVFFQFATPASGDIEGVTAGVGISGGGTSGTVTVTNSMATAIDAKGDLIAGTGADTFDRLAVGANDTVLIADSTAATGLKWGTVSGGGMTLISTTTLTGASVTLSSIPATYNSLFVVIRLPLNASDAQEVNMRFNADSNANRHNWNGNFTSQAMSFDTTFMRLCASIDNVTTQGLITLTIPDYANTTTWKMGYVYSITNNETTVTNGRIHAGNGFYNQTGAISSLLFFPQGGNFTSGTVLLYGVK
jgi:threonine/homoserine/homoserine lactone efflux protein